MPGVVEGLLWGAMPLFHVHTFLVFSVVVAAWSVARRRVAAMRGSLLVAVPLATFSVWQVTDGFAAARVVWWKPGWMIGAENPLLFLLENFGLLVPLAVAALLRPLPDRKGEERLQLGTGLALFVALFFVMLAPWEWDNTKAFVWAVLLMFGPLPAWLEARATALRTAMVALLLLPGVPAALGGFLASRPLVVFDRAEKDEVCAAIRSVPITARVATAQAFDHPVGLCGRAIVAGYAGHLWSHGLSARPVEERLARLMNGEPGWEEAARGPRRELRLLGSPRGACLPGVATPVGPGRRSRVEGRERRALSPSRVAAQRGLRRTTRARAASTTSPPTRVAAAGTSPNTR